MRQKQCKFYKKIINKFYNKLVTENLITKVKGLVGRLGHYN